MDERQADWAHQNPGLQFLYGNEVWTLRALERWLGHVVHVEEGRIPKDLLYCKLAQGKRPTARPKVRYKDVCKRELKAMDVDLTTWEAVVSDWTAWRHWERLVIL